jgi:8-oxo-dGTP diphosphatase
MGEPPKTYAGDEQMEARLEEQYLREYDPSQFDRPSVTVDILVFTIYQKKLCVLLIKRDMPPYIGKWAIPGGFIKMSESADQAAARKLEEETGIEGVKLEQLYTFSSVDRDPRTRDISIVYFAAVPYDKLSVVAGSGVKSAELFTVGQIQGDSVSGSPEEMDVSDAADILLTGRNGEEVPITDIAFDHATMIRYAVRRMRGKLDYTELGFDFLEDSSSFTLPELREVYEAVLDRPLDAGNFRRTILMKYVSGGRVRQVGVQKESVGRPAAVYSRTT